MSPYIFILIAFVFTIANRLYAKHTLNRLDNYGVTFLSNIFCAVALLPFAWSSFPLIATYPRTQIFLIASLGILWTVTAWLVNVSIAQNNFSFKEIVRQTRVLWVVLAGVFFLNETLSLADGIGIACIIGSVFLISYKHASLRDHLTSKPLLIAWASTFLVALITILEKIVLITTPAVMYAFFAFAIPSVLLPLWLNTQRITATKNLIQFHTP